MKPLVFLLLAISALAANASEDGVVLHCDQRKQELVVEYLLDTQAPDFWRADRNRVRFWDLLELERCGPERANAGDACTIVGTRSAVLTCQLGASRFSVHLAPRPYNHNVQGYCGARATGTIEVRRDGQVLLESMPLDPNQDCGSDALQVVRSVRIRLDESRAAVTYGPR